MTITQIREKRQILNMTAEALLLPFDRAESGTEVGTKRRQFNRLRWERIFFVLFAVIYSVLTAVSIVATVSTFGSWKEVNNVKMDLMLVKEDIDNKHESVLEVLADVQRIREDLLQMRAQLGNADKEEDAYSGTTDARNQDDQYEKADLAELGLTDDYYEDIMNEFNDDEDEDDDDDDGDDDNDDFIDYVYDDDLGGNDVDETVEDKNVDAAANDDSSGDDDDDDELTADDHYVGSGENNDNWVDDDDYDDDDEEDDDYSIDELNNNADGYNPIENGAARRKRRSTVDCKALKSKCKTLKGKKKRQCRKQQKEYCGKSKAAPSDLKSALYMAMDVMPNIHYDDTTYQVPCRYIHEMDGVLCLNRTFTPKKSNEALKIFKDSSFNNESGANSLARLVDNSKLYIKEHGIYLVYVQALLSGNATGMGVAIVHADKNNMVKGMAACVNGIHPDHMLSRSILEETCFVQRLFHLNVGDVLTVKGDSKIVVDGSETFFGIVKLRNLR